MFSSNVCLEDITCIYFFIILQVIDSDWDKQMLTYAVEYSVMNDEAFSAFLNESSAPQVPVRLNKLVSQANKVVQTDDSRETSPTGTGESHPILGELIQRQNAEISKLKQEKGELRKDIQTLLSCVLTMQKLAKISSKGAICPPVPPQVHDIASKYVIGGANYFSSVMENGWGAGSDDEHRPSVHIGETLKAVDEYDERSVVPESPQSSRFFGSSFVRENSPIVRGRMANISSVDKGSSSHGIPSLDEDCDDNSDFTSSGHQIHHPLSYDSLAATAKTGAASRNGMNSRGNEEKLGHNNNALASNKISTILM